MNALEMNARMTITFRAETGRGAVIVLNLAYDQIIRS